MDVALKYLAAFAAVCDEGGIGKASAVLHLTQPAVSYQVRSLEEQLGVRLFERTGRRLILTPEGECLRDFCKRFFAEFSVIRAKFASGDAGVSAPLRIASVSGFGRYVLFPLLCDGEHEELRFELWYPREDDVLEMVESGRCDLGFVYEARVSNQLEFAPVYLEEIVLVAPAGDARGARAWRLAETYETAPMITYDEGHFVFGKWFEAQFGRQPKTLFSACMFEELEEVVAMVGRGRGLSILPAHCVREAVERGEVRIVRPYARKLCTNSILAVTRSGAFVRPEAARLVERVATVSPPRSSPSM
jgi:DNA-binding transcriptional LysR family regulator